MKQTRLLLITAALVAGLHTKTFAEDAKPATPPATPPVTEEKKPQWESSAFLGLTLTRGNSDSVLFTGNIKTKKKDQNNEWAFGVDGAYGETDDVKNNETLHGFGQYNRLFNERLFGYLRLDALHDGIADIDYRVAFSPGLGYYFIKNKMTSLAAEVGPGVVTEKRGGEEDTYMTLRIAERFEHKFNDKARCWQSAEFLPQVDKFENYILNVEVGVAASITKSIELSIVAQDNYINQPAPGRKANDFRLISGVTYKF